VIPVLAIPVAPDRLDLLIPMRKLATATWRTEDIVRSKNGILEAFLRALSLLALACTQLSAQVKPANRTLQVKLNYTGAGTVDEKHKIFVLLFDANPFTSTTLIDATSQPMPPAPAPGVSHILTRQGAAAKDATLTFSSLSVSTVYAVFFLDKNGTYNGHPDSSSGSPMGVYGKLPDKLEPIKIEEGKPTQVVLTFDDSATMP
jgi:hypothetical protein